VVVVDDVVVVVVVVPAGPATAVPAKPIIKHTSSSSRVALPIETPPQRYFGPFSKQCSCQQST
jgi:hypothetical protein